MRKLKLLLMTLAILVGGIGSANAYSTSDLTSSGWTLVTDLTSLTLTDNYFVLVDAGASATAMALGNPATSDRPSYTTLANPFAASQQVWIIEASGSGYKLQSIVNEKYINSGSGGWDDSMSDSGTELTFTLNEGKYKISCATGVAGPWNNDGSVKTTDGYENIALNKSDAQAPGFKIYNISRTAYNAGRRNSSKLYAEGWLKVTATTGLGLAGSYYALLDVSESGYESGFAMTGATGGRPQSQALADPNTNKAQAWTIASHDEGKYVLQCAQDNKYFRCDGAGWNTGFVDDINADGTDFTFVLNEGKWTLSNEKDASNFVGRWANSVFHPFSGESIAANKAAGSGKKFYLIYSIPSVVGTATPLPNTGDMTADTWYYFDVDVAGEYNAVATNLGDISYYTSAAPAASSSFTAVSNLSQARYYVKSVTDNNLAISPHGYTYTVGDATLSISDGKYTQVKTFTATFDEATTNDPVGEFQILDASKITVNDAAATASIAGKVLTITLADALATSTDYAISVAAGAVGYNAENANTAINLTVHTPAVFDNTYFIATTDGTQFISRGGNSNTEAILDEFGIAATFTTDADNVTTITFVDNNKHLAGGSQSVYNDKTRADLEGEEAGKGARANWTISANADGYNIYSNKWSKYIGKGSGAEAPNYATVATYTDATPYKWKLVTPADHATTVAAYKDANAAAVATVANAAGITAVAGKTTVAALKAVIEGAGWVSKSIAVTDAITSVQEKYQYADTETPISENLTSLENGIYKVKLSVFKRIAGNDATYELYNNNQDSPTAYLFAGSNKAQVPSVMSESSTDAYTEGWNPNYAIAGNNYPNSMGAAGQAFDAGRYTLEVFAYVSDGTLSIGLKNPAKYTNGNWLCYRDLEVTQYKEFTGDYTALDAAITTAESNTLGFEKDEYAPYNNVAALTALAAAKTLNTNQNALTQTEIDNATTALTGAIWTANASDVECVYNGNFANELTGWTRTNPWGQKRDDVYGSTTGYYNQPGSLQYGNAGVYTMPLKTGTIYSLTFKYASWEDNSNGGMTVSVLNGENGMAAKTFEAYKTKYTNGLGEQTILFVTGAAGDYVLTLANSGNTVITGVSITKAANQYLEFADGSVPSYAPGTYPSVKITRSLTANRWVTAVYPFVISDADVNEIVDLSSYNAVTGELGFTSVSASTVNRPFLMRSTTDKTEITLTGVGVEDIINTPKRICDEASLIGVYATTTVDNTAKNYVLSNNTIYYIGENSATVNPYRAYIQIAQASEAPALTFTIDDETTAIEGINANESDDDAYYNLQGQRVTNPQNGVYIHKGRKVWVK